MNRPLRVMILEDNAQVRGMMARSLRRDPDISLVEVETLAEAEQVAFSEPEFVAVVDLNLADAHGIEAVHRMHENKPSITIVVVTGTGVDMERACLDAGAVTVVQKGSPEAFGDGLVRTVREAVVIHDFQLRHAGLHQRSNEMRAIIAAEGQRRLNSEQTDSGLSVLDEGSDKKSNRA